jgi:hypothetical protein
MDYIYKYRSPSDKRYLDILTPGIIYFSSPQDFNDPFDCYIPFAHDSLPEIAIYEIEKQQGRTLEEVEMQLYLKEIEKDPIAYAQFQKLIANGMQNLDFYRIASFSSQADNMLLWSHYADKHKGICIGLKVYDNNFIKIGSADIKPLTDAFKNGVLPLSGITYQDNMPIPFLDFVHDSGEKTLKYVTTKSKLWEYENEYRLVMTKDSLIRNPVHIRQEDIAEITFGANITEEDRKKIFDIIRDYNFGGNWIKFYQCGRAKNQYKIERVEINLC